jgi:hypothetical protein
MIEGGDDLGGGGIHVAAQPQRHIEGGVLRVVLELAERAAIDVGLKRQSAP